jgi:hypothetical protein
MLALMPFEKIVFTGWQALRLINLFNALPRPQFGH